MFEHRSSALIPWPRFLRRLANSALHGVPLIASSLVLGMAGHRCFENMPSIDAFANADDVARNGTAGAAANRWREDFRRLVRLFSGLALIGVAGILFALWCIAFCTGPISMRRPGKTDIARTVLLTLLGLPVLAGATQAAPHPEPAQGDYVIRDFRFGGGEVLPELKVHYFTLGTPARDANGRVTNAVLLLHGTYGRGTNFLTEGFAGDLFGTDQPLDARRFYIIVPDSLGHGKSTKPSDGLRAKFPRYGYADMVEAQRRLVTDGLGVQHLRLIIGTSMGGMHAWMWALSQPDFMDAVLPMVCLPRQIAGRNRMERRLIVDAIRNDPEWNGGDYAKQPQGLITAFRMVVIGAGSVKRYYLEAPSQEATDRLLDRQVRQRLQGADANDFLYAWEASRDYDPGPGLERIRAAVTAVNFEDDERNPPELGIMERDIKRVARGKYVLVPASERTRGHASFYDVGLWKVYLEELLERSAR